MKRILMKAIVGLVAGMGIGYGGFAVYLALPPSPPAATVSIEDRRMVWNWPYDAKGNFKTKEGPDFCMYLSGCKLAEWPY